MNIFILDSDIEKCAEYHCDQHVIKMILESVQLLCTALYKKGFKPPYKPTHPQHPCVLWVGDSYDNFLWLKELALTLNKEYQYRFKKKERHKSIAVLEAISTFNYDSKGLTPFVQVMPGEYKVPNNPVLAYRQYYFGEKRHFARWTTRDTPHWIKAMQHFSG